MSPEREPRANEDEYRNRRIVDAAERRDLKAEEQRRKDVQTVAASTEGRRLLSWLTTREETRTEGFRGNSQDAYNLGRWHVGEELKKYLKGILSRELYLEIVLPLKEEL